MYQKRLGTTDLDLGSAIFNECRAIWVQFPQQKGREPAYVTLTLSVLQKSLLLQSVAKNRHSSLHLPINVLRKQEKALFIY